MGMSIDNAIRDLVYLKGCGIFPFNYGTDARQLTIATDECIAVAVDTMRKYQMFQLDYEARLKADMVAMLSEIQLEIEEIEKFTNTVGWELRAKTPEEIKKECSDIIQQKINSLKEFKDGSNNN